MFRRTGKFDIYKIQRRYPDDKSWYVPTVCIKGSVGYSDNTTRLHDLEYGKYGESYIGDPELARIHREFTASGKCWQETGEHGVYNQYDAIKYMHALSKSNPDAKFRVVCFKVSQEQSVIFEK